MTSIPDERDATVAFGPKSVGLTNLTKVFWPKEGYTKRDLLQYYLDVKDALLPHLRDRAMVMKRYPNGIEGEFFFMKRTPPKHPDWLRTCRIEHDSGNVIDFPIIDDAAALMWVINLGCIDLNQWYARCDDVDRPDYLHFDLDPGAQTPFATVRKVALVVHDALDALEMPNYAKTTGSRGIHVYVPIVRGPTQKEVWTFAKALAQTIERNHPSIATSVYTVAKRPPGTVNVDYNQNRWGSTLASVYSVRPRPGAPVSMPVEWSEVKAGIEIDDFTIENARKRIAKRGDLWAPLAPGAKGRFDLHALMPPEEKRPKRRRRS
ncbi:MAG: non-homologous end-joining DNA ligase [Candidatus Eremiobacteraeota bacterium]|nr:non-homologous end-joining DNA ligase [Candidatus Eremiobacteraeota bacterium]MBV8355802.1 non-homologous end-joining DNA ligase [Candidatus Eremiobacteraeota bacterium]